MAGIPHQDGSAAQQLAALPWVEFYNAVIGLTPSLRRPLLREYLRWHPREWLLFCFPGELDGGLDDPARAAIIAAYAGRAYSEPPPRPTDFRVVEVSRGLGKTTLSTRLLLWRALYAKEEGICEIYRTLHGAQSASAGLRWLIPWRDEQLPAYWATPLGQLFPEARRSGTLGLWVLSTGYGETPFWFRGWGGELRGLLWRDRRPTVISGDDLDTDESVRSARQRQMAADKWKTAAGLLGPPGGGAIIRLRGTRVDDDGLTGRAAQDPAYTAVVLDIWLSEPTSPLWDTCRAIWADLSRSSPAEREAAARDYYNQHQEELDAGGQSAVPSKYGIFDLKLLEWQMGRTRFAREMRNRIEYDGLRTFDMARAARGRWEGAYVARANGVRVRLAGCASALWIDPRRSKNPHRNDYCAVALVAEDGDGYQYELATRIARCNHSGQYQMFWDLYQEAAAAGLTPVLGCESDTEDGDVFWEGLTAAAPPEAPGVSPRKSKDNKRELIASYQPQVENGHLVFCTSDADVIRQWVDMPTGEHDDAPDSVVHALDLLAGDEGIAAFMGWRS